MMDKKYEDLLEAYREIDFSAGADKEHTLSHCLRQLEGENENTSKEQPYMKKKVKKPATGIIAACVTLVILTASVYADDAIQWVKRAVLGNTTFELVTQEDINSKITIINENGESLEGAVGGIEIVQGSEGTTLHITDSSLAKYENLSDISPSDLEITFGSFSEAEEYFAYDYRTPSYLPQGFELDCVSIYKGDDGEPEVGTDRLNSYYTNGDERIAVNMRNAEDFQLSYVGVGDGMQEMTLNGYKAIILGNVLYIEIDGINYSLSSTDGVEMSELIKVAESLTETEPTATETAEYDMVTVNVNGRSVDISVEKGAGGSGKIDAADYEVSFDSFAEAEENYAYDFRTPTYLPEGYELDHVSIYNVTDIEQEGVADYLSSLLYSVYRNGAHRITVTMRNDKDSYFGMSIIETNHFEDGSYTIVTNPDLLQETTINGYVAVIFDNKLYIELDGINYELWGTNVDMDELTKVAESLTE